MPRAGCHAESPLRALNLSLCALLLRQVCQLAAAVEASSEHPLAQAVLEYAQAELSKPDSGQTTADRGKRQQAAAATKQHTVLTVAMYSLEDDNSSSSLRNGYSSTAVAGQQQQGLLRHSSGSGSNSNSSGTPRKRCISMEQGLNSRLAKQPVKSSGAVTPWGNSNGWNEELDGTGSPVSTPKRLKQMINSGLLKVSEVQNHPGKGVTAHLPVMAGLGGNSSSKQSLQQQHQQQVHIQANGSSQQLPPASGSSNSSSGRLCVALGNRLLMQEQGMVLLPEAEGYMESREGMGQTCVLVGINGSVVAALAISDPLKPEAAGVLAALQRQVRTKTHARLPAAVCAVLAVEDCMCVFACRGGACGAHPSYKSPVCVAILVCLRTRLHWGVGWY